MNRFLPSKKLIVFLVTILLILGCFFLFPKFKNRKTTYSVSVKKQAEISELTNQINQQILRNDTDKDGLKDWEENLWKTDPTNPDTDGDGTDDNSEILAKRDPLTAGPDDFLEENAPLNLNKEDQDNDNQNKPLTQTDLLSRELFVGYATLKQNNQLGTEQEDQFIDDLIEKNLSLNTNQPKNYTLDDLNITQNNSEESFQQYINNIKNIDNLAKNLESEIIIIKRVLETKNQDDLDKLTSNLEIYALMEKQLLNIEIPSEISESHLDLINALDKLEKNIEDMSQVFIDPIRSLNGIKNYFETGKLITEKIEEIMNSIKEITFK